MQVDVVDTNNTKVGDIELEDTVFGAKVKPWVFWDVVKMQLANRRRGTQSTKTATEVRGSGKKPFRQKGTGRARQGSNRAAQMRGGAVALGPKPRSYAYKLTKKMVKGALRCALSLRKNEERLHVVRGWTPEQPKTQEAAAVLERFEAAKALVVGGRDEENLAKSVRNLRTAKFLPVEGLNVRDILAYDHLFITDTVVAGINDRLRKEK